MLIRLSLLLLCLLLPSMGWANSLILDATTKSLELETGSTASTDYAVSYVDNTTTTFTPGLSHGNVAAITTTTILAAPAASTQRQVKWVSVRNRSGAASQTVTLKLDVSATDFHISPAITLELGESLLLDAEGGYTIFLATGVVKASVSQSGTWNIANITGTVSLPTGAATSALQDGIIKDGAGDTTQANVTSGRLHVDGSGVTQPVSGTFWQATQPVSGTFWQATQPVSGTTFDGIINDGTGDTTQANVSAGRLHVDGSGVTQPVSGTFWQATQPVSGTTFDGIIKDGTGDTTQANVTSGRLSVDGSGVTQPVSGTVTANVGTFPDNEPFNVAQINGATTQIATNGLNTTGAGLLASALTGQCDDTTPTALTENSFGHARVNCTTHQLFSHLSDGTTNVSVIAGTNALKTDLSSVAGTATVTAAAGVQKVGIVGNANAAFDAASAAAPPANRLAIGGLTSGATAGLMVSPTFCDSFANVTINTATTTLIVTGVSGRHVRICGISLVTAGANNVALISGTGATCGTGTTGMTGGTTAATGYNFAANGGLAQGAGIGEINRTNATGDSVCIVTSAAVQLSGRLSYAIY